MRLPPARWTPGKAMECIIEGRTTELLPELLGFAFSEEIEPCERRDTLSELLLRVSKGNERSSVWAAFCVVARECCDICFLNPATMAFHFLEDAPEPDGLCGDVEIERVIAFVSDLKMYITPSELEIPEGRMIHPSAIMRYCRFVEIAQLMRTGDLVSMLTTAEVEAHSDDFLRRSLAMNLLSAIVTSSLTKSCCFSLPMEHMKSLARGGASDIHWYVRSSAETAEYFLAEA